MKEALLDNRWMQDIVGKLMVAGLAEFLHIWELILVVQLQPDVQDEHGNSQSPDSSQPVRPIRPYSMGCLFSAMEAYLEVLGDKEVSVFPLVSSAQ